MLQLLFLLGVMAIPFNGVKGVGALGELSHELSVYPFMLAIAGVIAMKLVSAVAFETRGRTIGNGSPLPYIVAGIVLIIALSVLLNVSSIAGSYFHERSGFAKFTNSMMVVFYGLGLSYATYTLAPGRWQSLVILPIAVSVIFCLAYSAFEILAQHGALSAVYAKMDSAVHSNNGDLVFKWNGKINLKVVSNWDQRIRSLCFEPPAFGNFAGFAWPWLVAGYMSNKGAMRTFYTTLLFLFTALVIVSKARTGWVMLSVDILVLTALRFIYLVPVPGKFNRPLATGLIAAAAASLVGGGIFYLADFHNIVLHVIGGTSVSNISRLASQVSAMKIFEDHVLLGVGFGQYGFYVTQYMPNWGYLSYELRPWLIYPTAPWPSVYSLYARLACETGLVGLCAWIGLWLYLSYLVVTRSRRYLDQHGRLPTVAYALVMSFISVLVSSIATDTLRTPMIWISLGLGCAYLNSLALKGAVTKPAPRVVMPRLTTAHTD